MNYFADENVHSGKTAPTTPPGTVPVSLELSHSGAQEGAARVSLKVSWHVAPAQSVAILDVTGQTGEPGMTPLASVDPAAAVRQSNLQSCRRL
jgi:hypothetical protein